MSYEVPDCDIAESCFQCMGRQACDDFYKSLGWTDAEIEMNNNFVTGIIYDNIWVVDC